MLEKVDNVSKKLVRFVFFSERFNLFDVISNGLKFLLYNLLVILTILGQAVFVLIHNYLLESFQAELFTSSKQLHNTIQNLVMVRGRFQAICNSHRLIFDGTMQDLLSDRIPRALNT